MSPLAATPEPPYYAVVFTSLRSTTDPEGYGRTSQRMFELAAQQPGFLGVETARGAESVGITVSYWRDLDSIRNWRRHAEHQQVQAMGREVWYDRYRLRICRVETEYDFERATAATGAAPNDEAKP